MAIMFKHYLQIGIRNLLKGKIFTLINLVGLAVGLASCILIMAHINNELSFDRFHKKEVRIFRGVIKATSDEGWETTPQMVAALGPSMAEEFPEVERTVRFRVPEDRYLSYNHNSHLVKNVLYSDSTLFDVFSFRLIQGNPRKVLAAPFSIVLSVSTAKMIFGEENPVGKNVILDSKDLLTVTGIMEDAPFNSHIQYNAFISFSSLYEDKSLYLDWNGGWAYYTYILVYPNTDIPALTDKFQPFMDRHINYLFQGISFRESLYLQPLKSIYLHSGLNGEIGPVGNPAYLVLFSIVALLIFVIACINFINLTTTRSLVRLRETGVRKVFGSSRSGIVMQFLSESVLMNLTAILLAFIFAESVLPVLSNLIGQKLNIYQAMATPYMLIILVIIVLIGIFAGCYPAIYLSSFRTIDAVKNIVPIGKDSINLRKLTVLLQYTISIVMVICSFFLYKQLNFIRHTDLGFTSGNTLVVSLPTRDISRNHEYIKSAFADLPGIENVAACSNYPGIGLTSNGYKPEGLSESILINAMGGDEDLVQALGLKIVKGRNFSKSLITDGDKYIINETFARRMNWTDPVGKLIERSGNHEIIGVVNDFKFATLHEPIAPLIITMHPEDYFNYLLIKMKTEDDQHVIDELKKKWETLVPEIPIVYKYLEEVDRMAYDKEQHLAGLMLLFTLLTLLIAFMGLFGLSSFETEKQTKNIGIRKTNGAVTSEILFMLARKFTKWILISFLIACPVAGYAMSKWLQQFTYKTDLSWWIFLISGMLALIIALFTVSWQSWRAANRNPVDALRYE
jgi:putative ABC transport system permease protein